MPPPAPLHSDLSHRSPFVTYTGSWLATATYHSWVNPDPPPSSSSSSNPSSSSASTVGGEDAGSFNFAFDGTDFAVYGAWDADTAAWINVDGEKTWWHAPPPSDPEVLLADGQGSLLYRDTIEPGFHRISFNLASGRMDLVKVVVGDGYIGPEPFTWQQWHLAFGAAAAILAAVHVLAKRRRSHTALEVLPTSSSEKH